MGVEDRLRDAIRDGRRDDVEVLRAEVRRRFDGMFGLPASLMED